MAELVLQQLPYIHNAVWLTGTQGLSSNQATLMKSGHQSLWTEGFCSQVKAASHRTHICVACQLGSDLQVKHWDQLHTVSGFAGQFRTSGRKAGRMLTSPRAANQPEWVGQH